MKRLGLIVVAAAALGAAGWFARSTRRERTVAQAAILRLAEQQTALRRSNALATERLALLASRCSELETTRSAPPPAPPKTKPTPAVAEAVDPKMAAAVAAFAKTPFRDIALEQHPELQARYLASRRSEWTAKYGALWARLGLDAPQIDRFVANLTEAAAREMDLNAARRAQGLEDSDPAIAELRAQAAERAAAAQRELLGDAGFQQLQEYEIRMPMREVVDGLAATLVFLDAPLTAQQAERLIRVLVDANEGYRRSGRPDELYPPDILKQRPARETVDSARVLEQARTFLSPEQLAPLELQMVRMRQVNQIVNLLHESSPDPVIGFRWGRGPYP